MNVLSAIVSGILHSGESRISHIAQSINEGRRKHDSTKKQVSRFMNNDYIDTNTYYLPFAEMLLKTLAKSGSLTFAIDGSTVGSGCMVLMFSIIYKNRAIPIVWDVYRRKKGHFTENVHVALLKELKKIVPDHTRVCILGDGEFDGCDWQSEISDAGWDYVLRTGKNTLVEDRFEDIYKMRTVLPVRGEEIFIESALMGKKRFGEVNFLIWHRKDCKDPLLLVTNLDYGALIKAFYIKRFLIETFFRDVKSMGFNLHKSGLRCPKKLNRLIIACCIAYILCILAGIKAYKSKFYDLVAEADQNALSLFQIGLRFVKKLVDLRQWRAFGWRYDLGLSCKT
jgi:hypothetical protein